MSFNPDLNKQAEELIFSRKTNKLFHPSFPFNNIPSENSMSQKHLGSTLDVKLNLFKHIKNIPQKLVKLWAYCLYANQFYQEYLY